MSRRIFARRNGFIMAGPASRLAAVAGLAAGATAQGGDFVWTSASNGNFGDTARWTPSGAPTNAVDTAKIQLGGVFTVTMNVSPTIKSLNFDSASATLLASSRTFTIGNTFTIGSGTFDSRNSTIGGAGSLNITGGQMLARGTTNLNFNGSNAGTVWVQGGNTSGHATLNINGTLANTGTIRLESLNTNWNTLIAIGAGGELDNNAGGTIQVGLGTGGARGISGKIKNAGAIHIDSGIELLLSNSTFISDGGTIDANHRISGSTVGVSSSPASSVTLNLSGANTLVTDNLANSELWIRGSNADGHALLTAASAVTNHGIIRFESINSTWSSSADFSAGGLTNAADGVINVNLGTGGTRSITGSVTNLGQLNVQAGASLGISGGAGTTFNQQGGAINASGAVEIAGGTFNYTGGAVNGFVRVNNGKINIANTAGAGTVVSGGVTQLTNNSDSNAVVWVQGSNATGHAEMGLTADAENRGTIRMESVNSSWNSNIATGGSTLTNQGSGVIEVNLGTGGDRTINGNLVNKGAINVGAGSFAYITGNYQAAGGVINGNHAVYGLSTISTTASPAAESTIAAVGNTITFTGSLAQGYDLWVRGGNLGGNAATTFGSAGATINGKLRLESIDSSWNSGAIIGGVSLVNGAGGEIDANLGTGGARTISGLGYTFTNNGLVKVQAGTTLAFSAASDFTVAQAAGSINASGLADIQGGLFDYTGGSISGSVRVSSGKVKVGSGVDSTGTVIAAGATTLQDNLSPSTTVWVQGSNDRGHATLTPDKPGASTVTNNGIIRMESINSGWNSNIAAGDKLVNGATGEIDVNLGTGGDRTITGTLENQGAVKVQSGAFLGLPGINYIGAGGSISGNHAFYGGSTIATTAPAAVPHTLVSVGGTNTVVTDVTAGHEIWSRGGNFGGHANTAIADGVTNHGTLRLESIDSTWSSGFSVNGTGGNAGAFTNGEDGLVRVEPGTGGGRSLNATIDNKGTFRVNYGLSIVSAPSLGDITNSGLWSITAPVSCVFGSSQPGLTTTFYNAPGGTLNGFGTMVMNSGLGLVENDGTVSPGLSPGILSIDGSYMQDAAGVLAIDLGGYSVGSEFDRLAITHAANLSGSVLVSLLNGFVPQAGDRFRIITAHDVGGTLSVQSPSLPSSLALTAEFGADYVDLVVTQVPSPGVMGAMGMLGLAGLRRRRSRHGS